MAIHTTIYVNMSNTGTDSPTIPVPWSYNNYIATKGTSAQQITADLKDENDVSTGLTLDTINPVTGAVGSAGNATSGSGDWPVEVFRYGWYVGPAESPTKLRIGGLVSGDSFRLEIAGHQGTQSARDTTYSAGSESGLYDNSGTPTPTAPLVLEGTISGTTLDIDAALVDSYAYFTGFKLELTSPPAPSALPSKFSINSLAAYLRETGNYTNTQTNAIVFEWLLSEGVRRTQLNQMLYEFLGGLGHTGSLDDRLAKWDGPASGFPYTFPFTFPAPPLS